MDSRVRGNEGEGMRREPEWEEGCGHGGGAKGDAAQWWAPRRV